MGRIRIVLAAFALAGCADRDLRGSSTASPDGGTYLIIADNTGRKCGPLRVDGTVWPYPIDSAGPVAPGEHVIACGTDISVRVDSGRTYRFDYWGP